jgi:hypothetical protein
MNAPEVRARAVTQGERGDHAMTQRQFRLLLMVDCVVGVIGLVFAVASPYYLPPELRAYVEGPPVEELSWHDAFLLTGVLVMLILAVVTTVGLWRFRRWARGVRLWYGVACFASAFSSGPVVITGLASAVISLGTVIEGGLLALVYLSPVAAWFTGTSDTPRDA